MASSELPKFQPTPICCENATASEPLVDEELDELLELDELELLELEELLELDELLELEELQLFTTPPSPH
jgi:hypothetical protein